MTRPANLVGNLWMFPKTYIHKHPQHPQFFVGNGRSQLSQRSVRVEDAERVGILSFSDFDVAEFEEFLT